jgi:cyclic beta-1,2-glucan synthetase
LANTLRETVESHFKDASSGLEASIALKKRIGAVIDDMRELARNGVRFFSSTRLLLSIGYRVAEAMRDESCYDMLASKPGWSFFAIAKGDLRTRHGSGSGVP